MCKLSDVLTYIIDTYSSKEYPLSPARLLNILYLTDWKASISGNQPVSKILWRIIDSAPRVDSPTMREVIRAIERDGSKLGTNILGSTHRLFNNIPSPTERYSLNFVIDFAEGQSDDELNLMVNSTYPTITQDGEVGVIDLPSLAEKYNEVKPLLTAPSKSN
jgi:hypothetical protein